MFVKTRRADKAFEKQGRLETNKASQGHMGTGTGDNGKTKDKRKQSDRPSETVITQGGASKKEKGNSTQDTNPLSDIDDDTHGQRKENSAKNSRGEQSNEKPAKKDSKSPKQRDTNGEDSGTSLKKSSGNKGTFIDKIDEITARQRKMRRLDHRQTQNEGKDEAEADTSTSLDNPGHKTRGDHTSDSQDTNRKQAQDEFKRRPLDTNLPPDSQVGQAPLVLQYLPASGGYVGDIPKVSSGSPINRMNTGSMSHTSLPHKVDPKQPISSSSTPSLDTIADQEPPRKTKLNGSDAQYSDPTRSGQTSC